MAGPAWRWLGRRPYAEVLRLQRERREAVLAGEADEVLFLVEHDPVVTVGRRPAPGTPDPAELARHGVDFARVERGGLATWHGPGQLVAYAIVRAAARGMGVRGLVEALEDGVIAWLARRGVEAGRRPGYPGVWVHDPEAGRPGKIAALGLHFKRGVSMHGTALNLARPRGPGFDLIVPCGITDAGPTSLEAVAGSAPTPAEAAPELARDLAAAIAARSAPRVRG